MGKKHNQQLEVLTEKILHWSKVANEYVSSDSIFLHEEKEVKSKLALPVLQDIFSFLYEDKYVFKPEYKIGKNNVDFCVTNDIQDPCFFIEAKKYYQSEKSESVFKIDNEKNLKQIRGYFADSEKKPYFIILTNGIEYLFFTNFELTTRLDNYPFLRVSLLSDITTDIVEKLLKLLIIPFFSQSRNKKVLLRNAFYAETSYLRINLKSTRELQDVSQKQLAEILNCSQQRINAIENNRCGVTLKVVLEICNVLGCSIYEIIDGDSIKNNNPYYLNHLIKETKKYLNCQYLRDLMEDIESECYANGLLKYNN